MKAKREQDEEEIKSLKQKYESDMKSSLEEKMKGGPTNTSKG